MREPEGKENNDGVWYVRHLKRRRKMISVRITEDQRAYAEAFRDRLGKERFWKQPLFAWLVSEFGETCELFFPDGTEGGALHPHPWLLSFGRTNNQKLRRARRRFDKEKKIVPFEIQALERISARLSEKYGINVSRSLAMRSLLQAAIVREKKEGKQDETL